MQSKLLGYSHATHFKVLIQIAAQTFVEDKDFGLAVSYCASAEDWPGLGRVVDRVLEEYITNGMRELARTSCCYLTNEKVQHNLLDMLQT